MMDPETPRKNLCVGSTFFDSKSKKSLILASLVI